ncbi:bifunctional transcriptional activator/DNA repair enzyme Ada [bacterium BMS3Abin15]|nr:bifunctional transcriptional activator/DNA repair enzyme Ada [bacterium BMS3Abin15]HDZ85683.1 MGMT family protein [Candidatus Moranbacteria bacterium]
MRNYSKVGGRKGKPARHSLRPPATARHKRAGRQALTGGPGYRTPSIFKNKVFKIVASIPKGKTLSYKEVAIKAGKSKAYRAVGNILNKNCDPKIPCHRVIKSDEQAGGYNRGTNKKIKLLKNEAFK